MPFDKETILLKQVSDTEFETREKFTYTSNDGYEVSVPRGFKTDFASIPVSLTWLFPKYGNNTIAYILHDYLYRRVVPRQGMRYRKADQILHEANRILGVPFITRWVIFSALRLAGLVRQPLDVPKDPVVFLWGLLALPFVVLPVVTICLSLAVLKLGEIITFPLLKMFSKKKQVNRPRL